LPQFFQTAQGSDALGAGLRILPWTATLFIVAPLAGSAVNRIGERWLVVVGLSLQAAGIAWLATIAAPNVAYAQLIAPLIVAGTGVSMAMPATQRAVLNSVAPADVGKASGTYSMLRFLGGIFGVAVAVAVFGHAGALTSPHAFSAGFVAAMGVAAILSLVGAVAGMWTPNVAVSAAVVAPSRPSPASGV
jgi:MFS family permease